VLRVSKQSNNTVAIIVEQTSGLWKSAIAAPTPPDAGGIEKS
jgi:hypothetical protein